MVGGTARRLACCLLFLGQSLVLARVQLVTENPSPFVSSDPDDPQFIVSLFDDAAAAASVIPEAASLRSLVMADASGKRFNCSIPSGPPPPSTALAAPEDVPDAGLQIVKSPFELLEALTALCLYHKDGLWTYEICHRKHIRQFRKPVQTTDDGKIIVVLDAATADARAVLDAAAAGNVGAVLEQVLRLGLDNNGRKQEDFSCGQYLGDDQQTEAVLEDASSSGHAVKYVSHTFGGGAKCVLTGQPRTAEVRYTCARHIQENTVLSVREFPTCNYVVVVSTPFLCKHPEFLPQPEDVRLVSCVPLEQPPAAAAASGALPSSSTAAKPTRKASPGPEKQGQQQEQSASPQQEQQQQAADEAAGSEAAEAATGGAGQQPPEIGIELKRTKRKAAGAAGAGDSGPAGQGQEGQLDEQEEEDVNDVEGFVVESYTEEEGGGLEDEEQQQQQQGEAGGGSAGSAEAAAERGATLQPDRQEEL